MFKKFLALILFFGVSMCAHEFDPTIPVFDLRDFDDESKKEGLVLGVREALHTVGFFALTHSGINKAVINRAFAAMDDFYALDAETKMKYFAKETNGQRGYIPIGCEKAKGAKAGDFKEYYHIGRLWSEEQLNRLGYPANIWPSEVDFEEPLTAYIAQLEKCMQRVQRVISLALNEEESFYDSITKEGQSILRAVHYPPMASNDIDEQMIWCKEHTDINLFTILPEATSAGLEVQLADGTWMPVYAKEDSIIVNCGDFTEILTNGYFKSARHRVVSPGGCEVSERNSMVFFVHSESDYLFDPLQQWVAETGGVKKFPTATRIEMFAERMADNRQASDEFLKFLGECGVMERLLELGRASRDAMEELRSHGYASEAVLKALEEIETQG